MDCPVCLRAGVTTPKCPQCDSDLTALFAFDSLSVQHFNDGVRFARQQDWENAEKSLMSGLALDPTDISAMKLMAKVAYNQKHYDGSKRWYEQVLVIDESNSDAKEAINFLKGRLRTMKAVQIGLPVALGALILVGSIVLQRLSAGSSEDELQIRSLRSQVEQLSDSLRKSSAGIVQITYFTYRVKKGDSLWEISRRIYGDPTMFELIGTSNSIPPNRYGILDVGRNLRIPITQFHPRN